MAKQQKRSTLAVSRSTGLCRAALLCCLLGSCNGLIRWVPGADTVTVAAFVVGADVAISPVSG